MFRASLCPSSGEQRQCVTVCGVLRWFCWMWLVVVVGRCVVGCAPYNAAHGTIRTVNTTYAAALKTTTHPKSRCRKLQLNI